MSAKKSDQVSLACIQCTTGKIPEAIHIQINGVWPSFLTISASNSEIMNSLSDLTGGALWSDILHS